MCRLYTLGVLMATNLDIDDKLLKKALEIGGLRTKKETVTVALQEFIDSRRQREALKSFGTFEFREDWDYRKGRSRREPRR